MIFLFLFANQGIVYEQTNLNKLIQSSSQKYFKILGKDGDLVQQNCHKYNKEAGEKVQFFFEKINYPQQSIQNSGYRRRKQGLENRKRLKSFSLPCCLVENVIYYFCHFLLSCWRDFRWVVS